MRQCRQQICGVDQTAAVVGLKHDALLSECMTWQRQHRQPGQDLLLTIDAVEQARLQDRHDVVRQIARMIAFVG